MKRKHLLLVFGLLFLTSYLYSEDYYWRGQQGNWSDVNNWITSTGVTPLEVPSESDNVILNEESFLNPYDTLFIDSQNPSCNNFKVMNIPFPIVIEGGNSQEDFTIFGSFTSHQNVINNYHGNFVFMSQEIGKKITTNGSRFTGSLIFEGTGEWTLMDDLYVFADTVPWDTVVAVASSGSTASIFSSGPGIQHYRKVEAPEKVFIT